MDLTGKVAIVTGGTSGIGLATVKKFLELGCKVVAADWADNGADVIASLNSNQVLFHKTDVSQDQEVKTLVDVCVETFGRLDIVVANAGVGSTLLAHEETMEEWNRVIGINLTGVYLTCKYGLQQFLKQGTGGSIINMASILGFVGSPNAFAYSSAKGGVVNMTKTIAVTYARQGIRCNAIAPGYVDTPILDGMTPEIQAMLEQAHPIGRLGRSEEIAAAVAFLASDEASFVTGATLPVDGGYLSQ